MPARRILLILDALDMSGVAFSAQNLVKGLRANGAEVMVLASAGGAREENFREAGARILVSRYLGVPILGRGILHRVREFSPQIVHAQSISALGVGCRMASDLGLPLAVTANRLEDSADTAIHCKTNITIIAVSDAIRERLINQGGLQREQIRVIPNGLDLEHFPCPDWNLDEPRAHLPVVGTYGTLTEQKGQRVFLQAVSLVLARGVDAEFLIMGHGPDKPVLRRMAEELGVTSRVTFSPGTTTDMRNIRAIDLFVEPTFQEGLGLSVLQAMASGVPVIASGVGGLYSLVDDNETGILVASGDPEALANAICDLLASPAKRLELARHARERVEKDFNTKKIAGQLLEAYDSITG